MNVTNIETRDYEKGTVYWADVDGVTYGIYDTFDPATLMEQDKDFNVSACDSIAPEHVALYAEIAEAIEEAVQSQYRVIEGWEEVENELIEVFSVVDVDGCTINWGHFSDEEDAKDVCQDMNTGKFSDGSNLCQAKDSCLFA